MVCNADMTPLFIDIVHSLLNSQTSFQAAELNGHFWPQWEAIITDPAILQIVTGVKVAFTNSVAPRKYYGGPGVSNAPSILSSKLNLIKFLLKGSLSQRYRNQRNLFPKYFYDGKKMARIVPF